MSHTYLYQDSQKKSRRLSITIPAPLQPPAIFHTLTLRDKGKLHSHSPSGSDSGEDTVSRWFKGIRPDSSTHSLSPSPSPTRSRNSPSPPLQPGTPYISQPAGFSTASEMTLMDSGRMYPTAMCDSTVRLIDVDAGRGGSLRHISPSSRLIARSNSATNHILTGSGRSFSGSTINSNYHPGLTLDTEDTHPDKFTDIPLTNLSGEGPVSPDGSVLTNREPQLSWLLTVLSLIFVTVVRLLCRSPKK